MFIWIRDWSQIFNKKIFVLVIKIALGGKKNFVGTFTVVEYVRSEKRFRAKPNDRSVPAGHRAMKSFDHLRTKSREVDINK